MIFKESPDNKIKKELQDMKLGDLLTNMKEREREPEVRGYIDKTLRKLNN